jgi:hypothetical protein
MKRIFPFLIVFGILVSSCSNSTLTSESTQPPGGTPEPGIVIIDTAVPSACPNSEVGKIAEMVASSYSFTNTDEVLSWFCAGAEFEDILVALETEKTTGTAAEDTLQMRADGLTWEEIWQVVGLYKD